MFSASLPFGIEHEMEVKLTNCGDCVVKYKPGDTSVDIFPCKVHQSTFKHSEQVNLFFTQRINNVKQEITVP